MKRIYRDGKPVSEILPESRVLQWFHRNTPYSMDHATKHEGYEVRTVDLGDPKYGR